MSSALIDILKDDTESGRFDCYHYKTCLDNTISAGQFKIKSTYHVYRTLHKSIFDSQVKQVVLIWKCKKI